MSNKIFINDYDTKGDAIAKLRWWQVQALAEKFPNNQEFGAEIRKLVNKVTYIK